MRIIKKVRNIWALLLLPILAAIWWLSRYGTAEQQAVFTNVVRFYCLGAVALVVACAGVYLYRYLQNRKKGPGNG